MAYHRQVQWTPMYDHNHGTNEPQFLYKPTAATQALEVEDTPTYRKQTFRQRYLTGFKRTLRFFIFVACLVLVVNVAWLIDAKSRYGIQDNFGVIREGGCESIKKLNTWLHLLINILSTSLLTGSNAFMAAYSSPTRQEINRAHARRQWLHIGCVSFRNMRSISMRKSLVVLVLALSSVPFHLLYNSLVFTSLSSNEYYWAVTTEGFLQGDPYDPDYSLSDDFDTFQKSASTWERLDQKTCIQAYSNIFLPTRRNLVMVSSTKNETSSILKDGISRYGAGLDSNWWICSMGRQDGGNMACNPNNYLANPTSWTVFGEPIEYCMSEKVEGQCSVRFSMVIMIVVVSFNALKVAAMFWVLWRFNAEELLASVGDAARSFLESPDQTTWGICLASRRVIDSLWHSPGMAVAYHGRVRQRWKQAVSKGRWVFFFLIFVFSLGIVICFSIWGFSWVKHNGYPLTPSSFWSLGFGTLHQASLVLANGSDSPIAMAVLANIPQIFLSLIYLCYTGIMTAMFVSADWAKFGSTPQTLMVSTPVGKQRGTWLLSAPLGWGIGLLVLQTILHWLVSQSIFFGQINFLDVNGQPIALNYNSGRNSTVLNNCGFSPIAIVFTIVTGILLVITAICFMFRRFPAGSPPVVATCSAAISASCHLPSGMKSEATVYEDLRWGVTAYAPVGPHHVSLAPAEMTKSGRVLPPTDGFIYAGGKR